MISSFSSNVTIYKGIKGKIEKSHREKIDYSGFNGFIVNQYLLCPSAGTL